MRWRASDSEFRRSAAPVSSSTIPHGRRTLDTLPPPAPHPNFAGRRALPIKPMGSDADKTNDAQGGWLINTDATTFLSWMMAFGGGVLEGDGYHFLTPKNLAGLTFVKQVYDDGCAWTLAPAGDAPAAFAGRQAVFATANLEQLPDFARAMAAAEQRRQLDRSPLPRPGSGGMVTIYGSSYVVLKSTAERQLASWLFVRWMLSAENQKKWVEATGLFPLRTSMLASLSDYEKSHPQWSAAVDLIPAAQNRAATCILASGAGHGGGWLRCHVPIQHPVRPRRGDPGDHGKGRQRSVQVATGHCADERRRVFERRSV